jgi:hypothetical protein
VVVQASEEFIPVTRSEQRPRENLQASLIIDRNAAIPGEGEIGHWQEDAISWAFAPGGHPKPRIGGKPQEGAALSSGGGPGVGNPGRKWGRDQINGMFMNTEHVWDGFLAHPRTCLDRWRLLRPHPCFLVTRFRSLAILPKELPRIHSYEKTSHATMSLLSRLK